MVNSFFFFFAQAYLKDKFKMKPLILKINSSHDFIGKGKKD